MRQAQKKKDKDKVAIVLVLSFCVIALTSIFTLKSNIDKINDTENESGVPVSEGAQVQQGQDDQNAEPEMSAEASSDIPTVDSRQPSAAPGEYLNPVNSQDAKVTNPYSMDTLIYSVTLDQYMTHCGIDIEAPADSQVVAVAEGTVTAIYNDDRYGLSVEITHPGHVITIYSNLADSSELVEVGDVVTAGEIIGGVGSTGLFESLEPAHLHFEMLIDGAYVDPADHITF